MSIIDNNDKILAEEITTIILDTICQKSEERFERINTNLRVCCLNCCHFDEKSEYCLIAEPPRRPPAIVIAFACGKFELTIPF